MNGQGSPDSERTESRRGRTLPCFRAIIASLILLCAMTAHARAQNGVGDDRIDMRLQIAWGRGEPRLWRGWIGVESGELSDLRLLGLNADQPGSFIAEGSRIRIEPRFPTHYSGLEVSVSAPRNASLEIVLTPDLKTNERHTVSIPLVALMSEGRSDEFGNNHLMRIARVEGDSLRIRLNHDSMVFSPDEPLLLDIDPHLLNVKAGTTLRARLRLRRVDTQRRELTDLLTEWNPTQPNAQDLWTRTESVRVDGNGDIAPLPNIEVPVPQEEGVYNLIVDLGHRLQLGTFAKRSLQFVVIDPGRNRAANPRESVLVTEFNPADPRWLERLTQIPQLPVPLTQRGPWSNDEPEVTHAQGRTWTQLGEEKWVAYSLPVSEPGMPHVLDLELPAGIGQDVGISIMDGEHATVSVDSGVSIGDPDLTLPGVSLPTNTVHHRLVFWPTTSSPKLVIANQRTQGKVQFGRIRIESWPDGLPEPDRKNSRPNSRQRIASIDGHLLRSIFLAKNPWNADTRVSFDDWLTFYQAAIRLIDYLHYAGYDGAKISIASDGSSLFPSTLLNPTPYHDRGIFSGLGQDPWRKDVVEMLLRLFDRENLQLIPSIEFTTPLPVLEARLAEGRTVAEGIELIDIYGRPGADLQRQQNGQAPYYNVLDVRVRDAISQAVSEIVDRYEQHPSFRGLAINLSSVGYTHLPDSEWGFDSRSVATFLKDRQRGELQQPGVVRRLQQALSRQETTTLTKAWLDWRAQQVTSLYESMATIVRRNNPDHTLYLCLSQLAETSPWQRHLRPTLPRRATAAQAMLELGIDARKLANVQNVRLLRPQRFAPISRLAREAVNYESRAADVQEYFDSGGASCAQFDFDRLLTPLADFAGKGPPLPDPEGIIRSTLSFVGPAARQPFARSLSMMDDRHMFVGGVAFPMGEEAAVRSFFDVYRQLPDRPFATVDVTSDPLVLRQSMGPNDAWIYCVNSSPWSVDTNIRWKMPTDCNVTILGAKDAGIQKLYEQSEVNLTVEPYGLIAIRFSDPKISELGCRCRIRDRQVNTQLSLQLSQIVSRQEQILREHEPVELVRDAGFESTVGAEDSPWRPVATKGLVESDRQFKASGESSLHLRCEGDPALVVSNDFPAPPTGRLELRMKVRTTAKSAPLVVQLQSSDRWYQPIRTFDDREFTGEFRSVSLKFPNIPQDPNLRLRLQFELAAPGEVWLDDIQTYDKWFDKDEHTVLQQILHTAFSQRNNDQLGACYETLGGYWPRFLLRYVPPVAVAELPNSAPPAPRPAKQQRRFMDRLQRYLKIRL